MGRESRKVNDALIDFIENLTQKLGAQVNRNVTEDTPRDTGWAETNWIAKKGSPFTGTAGTREEAEAGRLLTGIQAQGLVSIKTYRLSDGNLYITNNVEYLKDLNDGTSSQAPRAFVQMSIVRSITGVI